MKNRILGVTFAIASILILAISCNAANSQEANKAETTGAQSIYDFTMKDIDGKDISLSQYKGKIIVIVNTASKCGLVGQLAEIESFYQKYKDKGVVVLGFPEVNFLGQEFDDNAEIKAFCTKNYGVTFQMFSKISVKGKDIHPLYQFLTNKSENGVVDAPIKWNYQKFIIDQNGRVVCSIAPRTSVSDQEFIQNIDDLLK